MGSVEPNVASRRLAQILAVRPVMHDAEMLVQSARVGGGPPDDGRTVVSQFERWPQGDLDMFRLLLRRKDLSDDWVGDKQAAGRGADRQFQEHFVHRKAPQLLFP